MTTWAITIAGSGFALLLLVFGGPLERLLERLFRGRTDGASDD